MHTIAIDTMWTWVQDTKWEVAMSEFWEGKVRGKVVVDPFLSLSLFHAHHGGWKARDPSPLGDV